MIKKLETIQEEFELGDLTEKTNQDQLDDLIEKTEGNDEENLGILIAAVDNSESEQEMPLDVKGQIAPLLNLEADKNDVAVAVDWKSAMKNQIQAHKDEWKVSFEEKLKIQKA